eukprot:TRINITY_DN10706_c0_g1_i3.p2 TRINITY_DN10706_c0_g1~~TRINITY_DN10706_c0_g1_i3.p2  ORF type:complete len:185 (-),score=40.76 TRINITY_DN10706_c0_g1_i3:7-561(-)
MPDLRFPDELEVSLETQEMLAVDDAYNILKSLGTKNLKPKFFLYAEVVSFKGVIKFVSREFLELMRATSASEILGRSHADFVPLAMSQYVAYMIHREMLASQVSTIVFEMIFGRCDGTLFKCVVSWSMSFDDSNTNRQDLIQIHLDSIEDLHVEPLGERLPHKRPRISLELDYADSPPPCDECE